MEILGMGGGGGGRGGRGGFAPRGGRGGAPGGPPQSLDPRSIKRLNDVLRMAKFTVNHRLVSLTFHSIFCLDRDADLARKTSRVFTMRGLTVQAAADLKFLLSGRDGEPDRMVTIVDYYKEIYNVTVTKPRLVSYFSNPLKSALTHSHVSHLDSATTSPSSSSTLLSSTVSISSIEF
jgi:eukaryotic translation initiation factor 2C